MPSTAAWLILICCSQTAAEKAFAERLEVRCPVVDYDSRSDRDISAGVRPRQVIAMVVATVEAPEPSPDQSTETPPGRNPRNRDDQRLKIQEVLYGSVFESSIPVDEISRRDFGEDSNTRPRIFSLNLIPEKPGVFSLNSALNRFRMLEISDLEHARALARVRQDYAVHVFCNNDGERERFSEVWKEFGFDTPLHPAVGALARGFLCDDARLVVVTDAEIFGRYKVQRPRRLKSARNTFPRARAPAMLALGQQDVAAM